jgi:O-methyltransferase
MYDRAPATTVAMTKMVVDLGVDFGLCHQRGDDEHFSAPHLMTMPSGDATLSDYFDMKEERFWRLLNHWRSESLLSVERLYALYSGALWLAKWPAGGALVECGCYKGGSLCIVLETLCELGSTERDVFIFDTFNGFPQETRDVSYSGEVLTRDAWITENYRAVTEANLSRSGYPHDRLHLVEGPVEVTIPAQAPERIAMLHLDTDYYESTRHELRWLYPRLEDGGLLFIDDYGHFEGCRRATDEFLARLRRPAFMHRTDYTGRMVVKQSALDPADWEY